MRQSIHISLALFICKQRDETCKNKTITSTIKHVMWTTSKEIKIVPMSAGGTIKTEQQLAK